MKNKFLLWFFIVLSWQALKPGFLNAQDKYLFFNNLHKAICFYRIEAVAEYLDSCLQDSTISSNDDNLLLAEIFSGNLDEKQFEAKRFTSDPPRDQFRFLQLNGWLLSQNRETNRAVDLWKNFISDSNNLQLQTKAVNELCRIYNDEGEPHKTILLMGAFNPLTADSCQVVTAFESAIELCRSYLLMADTLDSRHQLILADKLFQTHKQIPFSDRLILLNLKNILSDTNTYSLIQDINNQLDDQNTALRAIALQLLANQPGIVADTVFDLLSRSGEEWKSHQEHIAQMCSINGKTFQNSRNTVAKVKLWKEAGVTLQTITWVIAVFVLILITLIFRSYFRFIKTIRIKSEQIQEHRFQIELEMHESFRNVDDLVAQREANLHIELQERDKIDNELKEALQQAEAANFEKNAFLSNLSHEIRTPLNGIIGFSNLLENELALLDQPELFDYANSIERSGEKLLHLLNNIIDISRLEANDIEFNLVSCPVKEIADEILRKFAASASEKGIRLVSEMSNIRAIADPEMLAKVLYEIVDNAVKFTDKGFVRLNIAKDTDPLFVQISVRDTGIGIDSNYLPGLFEAYRRESSGYSRQYQGAALGIPLSRQLVERMNGKLSIESQKAVGTTVSILLPVAEEPVSSSNKPSFQKGERQWLKIEELMRNRKILIIESDPGFRKSTADYLKHLCEVQIAANGDEALNMIKKEAGENRIFDLVITDIHLQPPWDGEKLLQTIRSGFPAYANIRVIGLSAFDISVKAGNIHQTSYHAYLHKPFSQSQLFECIGKVYDKKLN